MRTRTGLICLAFAVLLSGCARRWLPVVDGMRAQTVLCELNNEDDDYNAKAPPGFEPAKDNRWILFLYDPAKDPKSHAAFQGIDDDCFLLEVPDDDEEGKTRHAAICAYERVPPPPSDFNF